ncbi:hypothetical protein Bca4012_088775 [Brassica carinata]
MPHGWRRSFSRSRLARSLAVTRSLFSLGADRSVVTRPFCRHLIVLSSLDCSVVTRRRSFSRGRSTRSLAVTQCRSFSRSRLARSLAVPWLDLSRSLARSPHSAQIILSQSLDSISRSRSARSLAVAWLDLSQSLARSPHSAQIVLSQLLGSIYLAVIRHRLFSRSRLGSFSRGHSTRSLAVTRLALCGYSSWIALLQLLGLDRSVAVTRIDLSRSLDSLSCGHSTHSLRLLIMDSSLAILGLDRSLVVTRIDLSRSLDSLSCGHSSWIALSQLLGADRSFAVPRIDLSRSLDSLSCSYSTRSLRLLIMDSSLVDTWLGSLSRSHSDQSLTVTRLALLRSLDSLFAVTRHG